MTEPSENWSVFVDYDNLLPAHKSAGILDILTRVLAQLPLPSEPIRAKCDVRVYGGWFEGAEMTRLAQDLAVRVQEDFPKVIRLPLAGGKYTSVQTHAELAVALLLEPGHHLFNTYRRKGRPYNVRVLKPAQVGCSDDACLLPLLRKLLRSGSCPKDQCSLGNGELVYRHEQKLVDTMLTCDLIHSANGQVNKLVLVSGDDDFLPTLRTISLKGIAPVRFHPMPNCQRASFPMGGARLLEMEL